MAVVAAVATAVVGTAVGGAIQAGAQHKAMRSARNEKEAAKWKVEELQRGRQDIINPYAGVQSLSDMATDLSSQMSNPFASLGVATQAAEIQMEQSDIALANSLDAMVATGAGAGGATALAQAALRSKKGVVKMKNLEHKVNNNYNNKKLQSNKDFKVLLYQKVKENKQQKQLENNLNLTFKRIELMLIYLTTLLKKQVLRKDKRKLELIEIVLQLVYLLVLVI